MQSIRSRSRFKMKNSLLKIDTAETVNNKNSPKLPLSLNAISQQQTGPLKPIVKMNSTIGSKSLLDTTSSNNNSKNNNNDNNNGTITYIDFNKFFFVQKNKRQRRRRRRTNELTITINILYYNN